MQYYDSEPIDGSDQYNDRSIDQTDESTRSHDAIEHWFDEF